MASPAVTSTTASGRHGVEVAPASRHSAETRRIVVIASCWVRFGRIDRLGEAKSRLLWSGIVPEVARGSEKARFWPLLSLLQLSF